MLKDIRQERREPCKAMPRFLGFGVWLLTKCLKGSRVLCARFNNNRVGCILRVELQDDLNYMNEGSLYTSRVIAKSQGVWGCESEGNQGVYQSSKCRVGGNKQCGIITIRGNRVRV